MSPALVGSTRSVKSSDTLSDSNQSFLVVANSKPLVFRKLATEISSKSRVKATDAESQRAGAVSFALSRLIIG